MQIIIERRNRGKKKSKKILIKSDKSVVEV